MAKKKTSFSITLQIGDQTYTATGETALAALQSLKKPAKIMAKALVTIRNGSLKKERIYYPVQAKRLFHTSTTAQEIQAKLLEAGMK